jgi:basic membrane protein A and related proteins
MKKKAIEFATVLLVAVLVLSACTPAAAPTVQPIVQTVVVQQTVQSTVIVPQTVKETVVVQETAVPDPQVVAKTFLSGKKICAVLAGPVNDAGWNTSAYNGLINLRDNLGMQFVYHESTKPEDSADLMRNYADAKCDIIYAHGQEYSDQVDTVAQENPNIQFIENSRCTGKAPNVIGVCYASGEGGYFLGYMAALITKTNKVAWVVGTKFPQIDWDPVMANQAVKDLGKSVVVDEKEVGDWNDPAKAKELTTALIAQGYDVFVLEADASDSGTIQAVADARKAGKNVIAISFVSDKNYLGPGYVIGGWEENIPKMIENSVMQYALAQKPITANLGQGLLSGGCKLNPTYGLIPQDVEQNLIALYQKYQQDPKSIPNLKVRSDF